MANQEHLDILRQGVGIWNQWTEKHFTVIPDFSDADLSSFYLANSDLCFANLCSADLRQADLRDANLSRANLSDANLRDANLGNANLRDANLSEANLSRADLSGTNLYSANLTKANLSYAKISYVDFSASNLSGADFSHAEMWRTSLGDRDLRVIKGLETIIHHSPLPLSINTIYLSEGDIPENFVRGTGAPDIFIEYMRALASKPIQYYTCFISYSSKDQAFAERLYADLQNNNVRCWYAPEDLKIGDKFRVRIDESIRIYDKLLLILSEHSVRSPWVETEVETAFSKEHKTGKLTLFPVKLDNTVEETEEAWAADIHRTRHIGDFTRWKEHDEYQKGLNRLLRDLKQEAIHDTIESDANRDQKQSTSRDIESS